MHTFDCTPLPKTGDDPIAHLYHKIAPLNSGCKWERKQFPFCYIADLLFQSSHKSRLLKYVQNSEELLDQSCAVVAREYNLTDGVIAAI